MRRGLRGTSHSIPSFLVTDSSMLIMGSVVLFQSSPPDDSPAQPQALQGRRTYLCSGALEMPRTSITPDLNSGPELPFAFIRHGHWSG